MFRGPQPGRLWPGGWPPSRTAGRTCAVATLGAHHGGSVLAALAWAAGPVPGARGPVARAVAGLPIRRARRCFPVSPVDQLACPFRPLPRRAAWREEATPPVSHIAMLYHPAVIARVAAFLRPVAAAHPEAGNP